MTASVYAIRRFVAIPALRLLLVGASCLLGLTGCEKSTDDPSTDLFSTYDRRALLNRVRDNAIEPAFHNLAHNTATLRAFGGQLSANITPTDLDALQAAWRRAALDWKPTQSFSFGPAETLNLASGIGSEANPVVIETALAGAVAASIDQNFIDTRPATAKGLWALEYLLFDPLGGDAAVLTSFTTASDADRRRAYIVALAADLDARATAAHDAWLTGAYREAFVAADGNDVTSSLSLLVNASVQEIETIKNDRLGVPLGDLNGGTAQPETAEGYRSGMSGALIQASLDGVRNVWASTPDARGISGLLDHLGAQSAGGQALSAAIEEKLAAARTLAPGDVVSQVGQARQPVVDLQNAIKQLTVLIKAEAVSKLGVLLTFNDNDGD